MTKQYIMAIDQGTTSTRVILYDQSGDTMGMVKKELPQIFQEPGWVEHDANQIWIDTEGLMQKVLTKYDISANEINSIGITNQRETTVLWDQKTGEPVAPAVVWQSKQSNSIADLLKGQNLEQKIYDKTGLWIDSYFSATKIMWLLKKHPELQKLMDENRLRFGTIDTWLLWKLTKGHVHATDYTNASRTMLFNIHTLQWDSELLKIYGINKNLLPEVKNSIDNFGSTVLKGVTINIGALAGDQQAALFGHKAFVPGAIKSTYGTGAFIVMNTGDQPKNSKHGLLTTIAYGLNGKVTYALEGSIFVAGSAVQWLEEGMEILDNSAISAEYAYQSSQSVPYQDIYLVPAFTGLGAPYWDQKIRGAAFGLTRATRKHDLVRATIESLAYQTKDVLDVMEIDTEMARTHLSIDGGAAANEYLHEFMANLLQIKITRPRKLEMTARGIAYMAGLQSGFWASLDQLPDNPETLTIDYDESYQPRMHKRYDNWKKSVKSAQMFASRN
ncbi:glycerol kinase GlpK [Weissella coleopterorum]|uniref:Glycerol kinase GlpK n=1 Tax=Weissella coleopterorum TaxID=2714949 RepID=A0A6G8AZT9_9LACO|nr:glycerol kinase GlpK [Weissella coleopterorum]QIL50611.1 glycerol kinase GlpK [Weissella coleopterorum]